ncbi:hypothetical protein FKP32DRAFT_1591589 [Trametes sanguinea]|nr:hypothetical protein FKP32DRAFT_1591589 [Trametes sanguinea]
MARSLWEPSLPSSRVPGKWPTLAPFWHILETYFTLSTPRRATRLTHLMISMPRYPRYCTFDGGEACHLTLCRVRWSPITTFSSQPLLRALFHRRREFDILFCARYANAHTALGLSGTGDQSVPSLLMSTCSLAACPLARPEAPERTRASPTSLHFSSVLGRGSGCPSPAPELCMLSATCSCALSTRL